VCRQEADLRLRRILFAAYFIEVGLVLIVLPWSAFWDRNLFLEWSTFVYDLTRSPFVRGAISGLGLVNVGVGCAEVFDALVGRALQQHAQDVPPVLSTFDEARRGGA
jgi:hypothetical protein